MATTITNTGETENSRSSRIVMSADNDVITIDTSEFDSFNGFMKGSVNDAIEVFGSGLPGALAADLADWDQWKDAAGLNPWVAAGNVGASGAWPFPMMKIERAGSGDAGSLTFDLTFKKSRKQD